MGFPEVSFCLSLMFTNVMCPGSASCLCGTLWSQYLQKQTRSVFRHLCYLLSSFRIAHAIFRLGIPVIRVLRSWKVIRLPFMSQVVSFCLPPDSLFHIFVPHVILTQRVRAPSCELLVVSTKLRIHFNSSWSVRSVKCALCRYGLDERTTQRQQGTPYALYRNSAPVLLAPLTYSLMASSCRPADLVFERTTAAWLMRLYRV